MCVESTMVKGIFLAMYSNIDLPKMYVRASKEFVGKRELGK